MTTHLALVLTWSRQKYHHSFGWKKQVYLIYSKMDQSIGIKTIKAQHKQKIT